MINRRIGTGRVVLISGILTAGGLLGYSFCPSYLWILAAALPLGFGQGAVDSSLNGYVATHYSSRHMNWLHASWGIGATIGPVIMTCSINSWGSWRNGYRIIAGVQFLLSMMFLIALPLWKKVPTHRTHKNAQLKTVKMRIIRGLKHPEPWVQGAIYLMYAAAEFIVGIWAASLLIESRHIPKETVGFWISLYYGGIMGGRFLTGIVADRLGNRFMVRGGLAVAAIGAIMLSISSFNVLALPGLLFLGCGFAPIYPCLMHETGSRFDEKTLHKVVGLQVGAACFGSAVIPSIVGLAASATTLEIVGPCVGMMVIILIISSEWLNRRMSLR
jgi:fucose permease